MTRFFKANHADAVIFSAGAGGGVPPETTLRVDLDGAVKSIKATENAGIKRYEMVSAAGSNDRRVWNTKFGNFPMYTYYLAKHYADLYLQQAGLNYTILHPVALSNDLETGKIQLNPQDLTQVSISRADVANVLVENFNLTRI
ncbi:MAG: NAD(P)-dependent oxidoreductase [Acetilactobacillus jinshanensis]